MLSSSWPLTRSICFSPLSLTEAFRRSCLSTALSKVSRKSGTSLMNLISSFSFKPRKIVGVMARTDTVDSCSSSRSASPKYSPSPNRAIRSSSPWGPLLITSAWPEATIKKRCLSLPSSTKSLSTSTSLASNELTKRCRISSSNSENRGMALRSFAVNEGTPFWKVMGRRSFLRSSTLVRFTRNVPPDTCTQGSSFRSNLGVIEPIWGAVLVVVASLLAVAVVTLRCKFESAIIFLIFLLLPYVLYLLHAQSIVHCTLAP